MLLFFTVPVRRFEVDILYAKASKPDYLEACVVTVLQIHASQPKGYILVFLLGQDEIENVEERLRQRTRVLGSSLGELVIAPIYSTLPAEIKQNFSRRPPRELVRLFL